MFAFFHLSLTFPVSKIEKRWIIIWLGTVNSMSERVREDVGIVLFHVILQYFLEYPE
jgi:hypothetical protein